MRCARTTACPIGSPVADQSPENALQTLVDRIVLERDMTCQIELKAVPGRQQRWPGMASPRGFEPRSHP
jgi:hypothetical protein